MEISSEGAADRVRCKRGRIKKKRMRKLFWKRPSPPTQPAGAGRRRARNNLPDVGQSPLELAYFAFAARNSLDTSSRFFFLLSYYVWNVCEAGVRRVSGVRSSPALALCYRT
ncbi:hypothetical protein EVAR_98759_1 [Eumeta japonica]|uniref:Uncharacterized protein n=1 Tax=Eumeta variegata TaxID=151549 RepID=A0A4C1YYD3_EUMVA|nr:hypothetical protein EVAR_98759_1 [Eumeta japonica]